MAMACERCKREIYKSESCNYCGRKICDACKKASQRNTKLARLVICKDCWSSLKKRTAYKNRVVLAQAAPAPAAPSGGRR